MKKFLLIILLLVPSSCLANTITATSSRLSITPQANNTNLANAPINDFIYTISASSTVLSASTTPVSTAIKDVNYLISTSSSQVNFCITAVSENVSPVSFYSIDQTIGIANPITGTTSRVSNGTTYINASSNGRTRGLPCSFSLITAGTSTQFSSIVSSSTAGGIIASTTALVAGLTPSATTYDIYSATNDATHTYARNPNLWASTTIGLSAIPAYSDNTGTQYNGALVAPDMILTANHVTPGVGNTLYFVSATSTTVSDTVASVVRIADTDIELARLTTPLPPIITPVPVMATGTVGSTINFSPLVPGTKVTDYALNYNPLPAMFSNQFRELHIGQASNFVSYFFSLATSTSLSSWYKRPISGDSASPSFWIVNGKLVLLGAFEFSQSPSNVNWYIAQIDAAMTALGSSYQLTSVDLSGFPSYP